jgi:hypothetical protein
VARFRGAVDVPPIMRSAPAGSLAVSIEEVEEVEEMAESAGDG